MIPFEITLTTHTSRNRGYKTSTSVWFDAGGLSLGWLHPFQTGMQADAIRYARAAGRISGSSKRHDFWRIEDGDAACAALFGTTTHDEIARAVMVETPVLYAPTRPGYVVREAKLLEFYRSRCRDTTWTKTIKLKQIHAEARDLILSGVVEPVREVDGFLVRNVVLSAASRVRQEWACGECGLTGHRDVFRERRTDLGSALDCPTCPPREPSTVGALLAGPSRSRGMVVPAPSAAILPAW